MHDDRPMYVISVAATLAGMHPQTLRQYDRLGLVSPSRSAGRGRRYSAKDIARLQEVQRLSQDEGVNLAGIKRILELETQVEAMTQELERYRAFAVQAQRIFAADAAGSVEPLQRGQRAPRRIAGLIGSSRSTDHDASTAMVVWRN